MATTETMRQHANGGWYPAVPLKAPLDVRWMCEHDWTPHRHDSGETSFVDWDCLRCGAEAESGHAPPKPWRVRRWLAAHLTPYGRAVA